MGSNRLANPSTAANGESHIYIKCDWRFSTKKKSLNQHISSCHLKNKLTDVETPYKRNEDDASNQTSDDSNIEFSDISIPSLQYKWGSYQDYLIERNLSLSYEKIV